MNHFIDHIGSIPLPCWQSRKSGAASVRPRGVTAWLFIVAFIGLGFSKTAFGDFKVMTTRLPYGSNALMAVDTEKLFQSSVARNAGWTDEQPAGPGRQPRLVLPNTRRLVLGSMLRFSNMQPLWSVSIMEPSGPIAPNTSFSRVQGARVDNLGPMPAVWAPSDAYFFLLDGTSYGAVTPADRQFAIRWLGQIVTPSEYLQRAAAVADQSGATIVLAVDLSDAIGAPRLAEALEISPLQASPPGVNAANLAQLISSIRGLTLQLQVSDRATGTATIDFNSNCAILGASARPILLDLLARTGMSIGDLESWDFSVAGQSVTARGTLSVDGLERILSVITPPRIDQVAISPKGGSEGRKIAASQRYFTSVSRMIDRFKVGSALSDSAGWLTRDSRAIGNLPLVDVDNDLAAWGADVSASLVEISAVFEAGQARATARSAGVSMPAGPFNSGQWGDNGVAEREYQVALANANNQRRQAAMEERARTVEQASRLLKTMIASREKIRAAMVQRYHVEF